MADLSMFANPAEQHAYPSGHVFFSLGDPGDVMYVVLSGEVDIFIRDKIVETVRSGGIFGEMAVIDDRERSAAARARAHAAHLLRRGHERDGQSLAPPERSAALGVAGIVRLP